MKTDRNTEHAPVRMTPAGMKNGESDSTPATKVVLAGINQLFSCCSGEGVFTHSAASGKFGSSATRRLS